MSGQASLTATPSGLSFGSVLVGNTLNLSVTIKNVGNLTCVISSIVFSDSHFSLVVGGPTSLIPGASVVWTVKFTPTVGGAVSGTLKSYNNGLPNPLVIGLNANGIAVPSPACSIIPGVYDFGSLVSGAGVGSQIFVITNTGNADLHVTGITDSFGAGDPFAISAPGLPWTIIPGATHNFTVTFTPLISNVGLMKDTISVASDDPATPTLVQLSGTGVAFTPVGIVSGLVDNVLVGTQDSGTGAINLALFDPNNLNCEDTAYLYFNHHHWGAPGHEKVFENLYLEYEDIGVAQISVWLDCVRKTQSPRTYTIGTVAADRNRRRALIPVDKLAHELISIRISRVASSGPVRIVAIEPHFRVGGESLA